MEEKEEGLWIVDIHKRKMKKLKCSDLQVIKLSYIDIVQGFYHSKNN